MTDAGQLIEQLDLQPHPEGGWYRETWRDERGGSRGHGSCIYYLLEQGQVSRWHRVDATEIWHFYAGHPLRLSVSRPSGGWVDRLLGCNMMAGEVPQVIIPPALWQRAEAAWGWTLVGCTVSPAFTFDGFELAPEGWSPHG